MIIGTRTCVQNSSQCTSYLSDFPPKPWVWNQNAKTAFPLLSRIVALYAVNCEEGVLKRRPMQVADTGVIEFNQTQVFSFPYDFTFQDTNGEQKENQFSLREKKRLNW